MDHGAQIERVQGAFTQQAAAYAAAAAVTDPDRIARFIQATSPEPAYRVLDIATGPGYVAEAFAAVCREVVGVDVTPAPLALAEQRRTERNVSNLLFRHADAHALPFAAATFDIVVCRFAVHHFLDPIHVLHEMVRVCRRNGTVAVEDLVVSEHPSRAAYQNQVERLRDASHTAACALSELLRLFTATGLDIEAVSTNTITQEVDAWLAVARTPQEQAREARRMLDHDSAADVSGTRPYHDAQGQLCFHQRTAIVVGRKLA